MRQQFNFRLMNTVILIRNLNWNKMAAEGQAPQPGQDLARFCAQLEDYTPTVRPIAIKLMHALMCPKIAILCRFQTLSHCTTSRRPAFTQMTPECV